MSGDLKSFQQHLCSSRRILALVGAGLSASSGLPTFRGAGGLWQGYDATELATPEAFASDPSLVWKFYNFRRNMALKAKPNAAHYALAELARRRNFVCLTQNVDGLSPRARHPQDKLLPLHGDLYTLRCTSFMCNFKCTNYDKNLIPESEGDEFPLGPENKDDHTNGTHHTHMGKKSHLGHPSLDELPKCPKCSGLLRPGVIWFGEPLPLDVMDSADAFIKDGVDLMLVIGTSGSVWPAAGYVEQVALAGGKVAVFNTEESTVDYPGWFFQGDAAKTLPVALEPVIGKIKSD